MSYLFLLTRNRLLRDGSAYYVSSTHVIKIYLRYGSQTNRFLESSRYELKFLVNAHYPRRTISKEIDMDWPGPCPHVSWGDLASCNRSIQSAPFCKLYNTYSDFNAPSVNSVDSAKILFNREWLAANQQGSTRSISNSLVFGLIEWHVLLDSVLNLHGQDKK